MFGRHQFGTTKFGFLAISGSTPPVVNAGVDRTVSYGATSIDLVGSATDPDNDPLTYSWSLVSGPNTPTIVSPTSLSTSVTGVVVGIYTFSLTLSDGTYNVN